MLTRRQSLAALALAFAAPAFPALAAGALTVPYGDDPRQKLDIHARPGLAAAPVLVFVHGGGWSLGDRTAVNALPDYAVRHGLLLVSVDYRLTPQVDAGGCATDVAAALAWVMDHIAAQGGDPERIFLAGHSAGAHLAALVAADPAWLGAHGHAPGALAGVILLDGAGYDVAAQMDTLAGRRGPLARMYQAAFGTRERAQALSPTLRVGPGQALPPFLIFHVESREDSARQSHGLAEALTAAGGQALVIAAPGETHMSLNRDFGKSGDPEGERAAAFIASGRL